MARDASAAPPGAIEQRIGVIAVNTQGGRLADVTRQIAAWLTAERARDGLLTLFLRHTSASLVIQENADPDVQVDLVTALDRLAPRNAGWVHVTEGPDDMPAHVKTMLTGVNLSIPVAAGRMLLGTWQGIYVAEHRDSPHQRQMALHFLGSVGRQATSLVQA